MPSSACSIDRPYRNNDIPSIAITIARAATLPGMKTLGDRVKWAREYAKLTQPELCKKVGMSQSRLWALENAPTPKGPTFIVKIALACRVSAYWLETGKGAREMGALEATILGLPDAEQREWLAMIKARNSTKGVT